MKTILSNFGLAQDITENNGESILFIHGMLDSGYAAWPGQKELGNEFQLNFVHLPGFGQSPSNGNQDFEYDSHLIAKLLDEKKYHIVGHSYGGIVALMSAIQNPANVLSLTLVETAQFNLTIERPFSKKFIKEMSHNLQSTQWSDEKFAKKAIATIEPAIWFILPFVKLPEVIVKGLTRFRFARKLTESQVTKEQISQLNFPILLISGGHNKAYDEVLDEIHSSAKLSKKVTIKGQRHSPHKVSNKFNTVISQFIKNRN